MKTISGDRTELDQSEEQIREIYQDLREEYGDPEDLSGREGMRQLLITILSQNVADENTARAAEALFDSYRDYQEIEEASIEELAEVINPAGLPETKARRIQRTLKAVREENGEYSTDFLADWDDGEAQEWLEAIKGIGPKTASILMNFQFDADVMPVDTHVERISKRFRLVPFSASNQKAHEILNEIVPRELKTPLHLLMIDHGKNHCTARKPSCGETELKKYCSRYQLVEKDDLGVEEYPPEELR